MENQITPEQKATQLYGEFSDKFYDLEAKQDIQLDHELIDEEAIKCGLICIDEIIASLIKLHPEYDEKYFWHPIDYWKEVKEELQRKKL